MSSEKELTKLKEDLQWFNKVLNDASVKLKECIDMLSNEHIARLNSIKEEVGTLNNTVDRLQERYNLLSSSLKETQLSIKNAVSHPGKKEEMKRVVSGTSKLILIRDSDPQYIFISRRKQSDKETESCKFIDNIARDKFFSCCKNRMNKSISGIYSITKNSPFYGDWIKYFE